LNPHLVCHSNCR